MAVMPMQMGNVNQMMSNVAHTVGRDQFIRELVYNGIQAAERAGGGDVVVDHTDVAGVPKLRFWDTGDGMTRAELVSRLGVFAADDRTGRNFGIGIKVSLVKVSPRGVVYITVRDGQAFEMTLAAEDGDFGPRVLNPGGADDVERVTRPVPLDDERIPAKIRTAGHGTCAVLLGTSDVDASAISLAPPAAEGESARRWVSHLLNDRFAAFPDGISVSVNAFGVHVGGKSDSRAIRGSAGHADYYVAKPGQRCGDIAVDGASGQVSLPGPVPATAHWWVLPTHQLKDGVRRKRGISSLYRIGGKVRVVVDDETYLASSRAFRDAGIWSNTGRIQIHIVPDAGVDVAIEPSRTSAVIAGMPAHEALQGWCVELGRKLPKAIKDLQTHSPSRSAGDRHGSAIKDLYTGLSASFVRSNRGRLSAVSAGHLVDTATSGGGVVADGAARRLRDRLRERRDRLRSKAGSTVSNPANGDGSTSTFEVVTPVDGGALRGQRAAGPDLSAPDVRWVNDRPDNRSDELTAERVGFYVPSTHTLVLNANFTMIGMLTDMHAGEVAHFANSREKVTEYVMSTFEGQMRSLATGNLLICRGDRGKLAERLTDEALAVAACEVRQVSYRIKQAVRGQFGTGPAADMEDAA